MSKKLSRNPKAIEAQERKENEKVQKRTAEQERKEAQKWEDDHKLLQRKEERKKEREEKKIREQERKNEKKQLEQEEEKTLNPRKGQPPKKTRFQIEQQRNALLATLQAQVKAEEKKQQKELEENLHEDLNPNKPKDDLEVVTAEDLMEDSKLDKHPEKRMKAAWNSFLDERLPEMKKENPGMKRSQHIELLKKEWKKSPKNPMNQEHVSYNTKI